METDLPALIEDTWAHAQPGREAACTNEFMRALLALIEERPQPPHWPCRRDHRLPAP
jgi:hypothetical protein